MTTHCRFWRQSEALLDTICMWNVHLMQLDQSSKQSHYLQTSFHLIFFLLNNRIMIESKAD